MIKELLELAKTIRDEKKYRSQLLKNNFNVDAFEYFCKKARIDNIEITLDFANGQKATIKPKTVKDFGYKSFAEKYKEAQLKQVVE